VNAHAEIGTLSALFLNGEMDTGLTLATFLQRAL